MNYLKRFYLNLKKFQVLSQSLKVKRKKRKIINSIGAKNFNAFVEIAIVIMITSLLGQESSSNILHGMIWHGKQVCQEYMEVYIFNLQI